MTPTLTLSERFQQWYFNLIYRCFDRPVGADMEDAMPDFAEIPATDHRLMDEDEVRAAYKAQRQELAGLRQRVQELEKEVGFDDLPWTEAFKVKRDGGHGMLSRIDIGILARIARNRYRKALKLKQQLETAQTAYTMIWGKLLAAEERERKLIAAMQGAK